MIEVTQTKTKPAITRSLHQFTTWSRWHKRKPNQQ